MNRWVICGDMNDEYFENEVILCAKQFLKVYKCFFKRLMALFLRFIMCPIFVVLSKLYIHIMKKVFLKYSQVLPFN